MHSITTLIRILIVEAETFVRMDAVEIPALDSMNGLKLLAAVRDR